MTDYITSAALKSTLNITTAYADSDIAAAITAASQGIDQACHRRGTTSRLGFQADADTTQIRYYTPRSAGYVDIDDLVTFTALATDSAGDGTFPDSWTQNTDFILDDLNAAAEGRPYERLTVHPNGSFLFPVGFPRSVRVTGKFGWPAVPQAVVEATTIIASKLLKRSREAPWGVVAVGADGAAIRMARSDPDVRFLLGPYMKHRVAVG